MYNANFISSPEGYFHTVVCNAHEFSNTTVNSDLHYISWDNPPKQHPHYLTLDHMQKMIESDAPFLESFIETILCLIRLILSFFSGARKGSFLEGGALETVRMVRVLDQSNANRKNCRRNVLQQGCGSKAIKMDKDSERVLGLTLSRATSKASSLLGRFCWLCGEARKLVAHEEL
ncbi:beta-glucuronosyltransferase GlcAT14B-like protein [Tanacetum coccineum]